MQQLPVSENALVLRTDFTDNAAWREVCAAIQEPVGEFQASVDFLDDPQYENVSVEQLPDLLSSGQDYFFIFIVDKVTISHLERPILVADLSTDPVQTFRTIPSMMWAVEGNLSISNMDFKDFAVAVDSDGIFRGFQ